MSAGGWVEGGVLLTFGAGLAFGRRHQWRGYDRTARCALVVRVGIPVFLGATALSSAAGAAPVVSAVLVGLFAVCVVSAVGLGASIRIRVRCRRREDAPSARSGWGPPTSPPD